MSASGSALAVSRDCLVYPVDACEVGHMSAVGDARILHAADCQASSRRARQVVWKTSAGNERRSCLVYARAASSCVTGCRLQVMEEGRPQLICGRPCLSVEGISSQSTPRGRSPRALSTQRCGLLTPLIGYWRAPVNETVLLKFSIGVQPGQDPLLQTVPVKRQTTPLLCR